MDSHTKNNFFDFSTTKEILNKYKLMLEKQKEKLKNYSANEMKLQNNISDIYLQIGKIYSNQNEPQKALDNYNFALEYNSLNPEAWTEKSLALHRLGQPLDGLKCCEKVLKEIQTDYLSAYAAKITILTLNDLGGGDSAIFNFANKKIAHN